MPPFFLTRGGLPRRGNQGRCVVLCVTKMIIHATRKLAQRLPDVSAEPLTETSPLGSWHADRLTIDRRQCVLFCHDETRAALFAAGLRKPQFTALGNDVFKPLFADTLATLGCPDVQVRRALLVLGRCQFDTATDRSVLSSMRVARQDLEAYVWRFPNVLTVDPVEASCRLSRRPASILGSKFIRPNRLLLEMIAGLPSTG